jgi:hypothetical protein
MITNILLVISIWPSKMITSTESEMKKRKRRKLTLTVLVVTFSFLILTTPGAIVSAFFYLDLNSYPVGQLVVYLLDNISFSYNGFGFLFLILSNKNYANEFKKLTCSIFVKITNKVQPNSLFQENKVSSAIDNTKIKSTIAS